MKNFRRVIVVVVFEKKPVKINIIPLDRCLFFFTFMYIYIYVYIKAAVLLVIIYLQTHTHTIRYIDIRCGEGYMSLRIIDLKKPEEIISMVHLMTHCGRKKEMNDPYETNLPSHTHTHLYIPYCV